MLLGARKAQTPAPWKSGGTGSVFPGTARQGPAPRSLTTHPSLQNHEMKTPDAQAARPVGFVSTWGH